MAVYVDSLRPQPSCFPSDEGCHLFASSDGELHRFAEKIGLKPHWCHRGTITHYDLTPSMRQRATKNGNSTQRVKSRAHLPTPTTEHCTWPRKTQTFTPSMLPPARRNGNSLPRPLW